MGHVLAENRNGLIVTVTATEANGTARRIGRWTCMCPEIDARLRAQRPGAATRTPRPKATSSGIEAAGSKACIPLVKVPVDPKTVTPAQQATSGIRASSDEAWRMGTEGYRFEPAVSDAGERVPLPTPEMVGEIRLTRIGRPMSGSVVGGVGGGVQPGEDAATRSRCRLRVQERRRVRNYSPATSVSSGLTIKRSREKCLEFGVFRQPAKLVTTNS